MTHRMTATLPNTPCPYGQALEWIEANPDTGSAKVLARLILSEASGGAFGIDQCKGTLDSRLLRIAEAVAASAGGKPLADAAARIREKYAATYGY